MLLSSGVKDETETKDLSEIKGKCETETDVVQSTMISDNIKITSKNDTMATITIENNFDIDESNSLYNNSNNNNNNNNKNNNNNNDNKNNNNNKIKIKNDENKNLKKTINDTIISFQEEMLLYNDLLLLPVNCKIIDIESPWTDTEELRKYMIENCITSKSWKRRQKCVNLLCNDDALVQKGSLGKILIDICSAIYMTVSTYVKRIIIIFMTICLSLSTCLFLSLPLFLSLSLSLSLLSLFLFHSLSLFLSLSLSLSLSISPSHSFSLSLSLFLSF